MSRNQDSWYCIFQVKIYSLNKRFTINREVNKWKHHCCCVAIFSSEVRPISKQIQSLGEKSQNAEFFLVHIFPHSDWIRRHTEYLSVFSPNAGNYRPEKTPYLDTFHAVNQSIRLCRDQYKNCRKDWKYGRNNSKTCHFWIENYVILPRK